MKKEQYKIKEIVASKQKLETKTDKKMNRFHEFILIIQGREFLK